MAIGTDCRVHLVMREIRVAIGTNTPRDERDSCGDKH